MTIRKGSEWGSPYEVTGTEVVAHSDAEAMASIGLALDHSEVPAPVVLRGGDLFQMLGGRPADPPQRFPIDVVEVTADGRSFRAVAHVVVRRRVWSGPFVVAMNAASLGEWNLGPRAHPNDGLLDITEGSLGVRERVQARSRARTGSHLPHPSLRTRRVAAAEFTFDRPMPLLVDGEQVGTCTELQLTVVPDAATVVI